MAWSTNCSRRSRHAASFVSELAELLEPVLHVHSECGAVYVDHGAGETVGIEVRGQGSGVRNHAALCALSSAALE